VAEAVSPPVGRSVAGSAYLLAAATTFLWVACSLPAGPAQIATDHRDATTPIHREAILLVPALLLLVLLPVGMALARRVRGALSVLASTDAFVAVYAGMALGTSPTRDDPAARIMLGILLVLGLLSAVEAWRCTRPDGNALKVPALRGVRLAICLIVLMTPPDLLLSDQRERASLLAPFLLVTLGSGGALMVKTLPGLRAVCGLVLVLVAAHLVVTLRLTLHEGDPPLAALGLSGQATLALAIAVAVLAAVHWVFLLREVRRGGAS